ncbi:MAG: hypothetical protein IH984_09020 [Planctomycetes bacterium]|nr:hypothetical protein [Planctomycetota bacterium]
MLATRAALSEIGSLKALCKDLGELPMHETRNFILVIALICSIIWAVIVWLVLADSSASAILSQRNASLAVIIASASWLFYALKFEDKLPDHMRQVLGDIYYDVDGLSFMPIIRSNGEQAELSLYYQNRYENPVEGIVHLRPPEDCFVIRPGMRDVHFAFKADGGDFGVIHQQIAVPQRIQGDVINVQLAAASWYPRSHGTRLRKHTGLGCGTLDVDWTGSAFKTGVHEVSGEIELHNPAILHLSMPKNVSSTITGQEIWKQEQLVAGAVG